MQPWLIASVALLYLLVLFAVARFGDTYQQNKGLRSRTTIYPLSLAIYCTSWTFFGSVGLAASSGLEFLSIYIGPILIITVGYPLLSKIARLSKHERITSIADFLGARYGKSVIVAAVATFIAVVGTVPYIALQLKAVSSSVSTLISPDSLQFTTDIPMLGSVFGDISLLIVICLAVFTILFGTRHTDATEHQHGLILAIALESFIKLAAFLLVGTFVTFFMFNGIGDLFQKAVDNENIQAVVDRGFDFSNAIILTLLSALVFILLPRQFHVAIVENQSSKELSRARWLFPLYLLLINLFVIPIAAAGLITFGSEINADNFVLALPQSTNNVMVSLIAFIGGLSAGTAMVIVACVALAIMISNHVVLPLYLRAQKTQSENDGTNMEQRILNIRRASITVILLLAFAYYKFADNTQALASIGLISFAAIAQLAPSFFGGLIWRKANARGALTGMSIGFITWVYTLLLPTFSAEGGFFNPTVWDPLTILGVYLSPLGTGVFWSLVLNSIGFIFGSLSRKARPLEDHQATLFVGYRQDDEMDSTDGNANVTIDQIFKTHERYLGTNRTERAFSRFWNEVGYTAKKNELATPEIIRFSEQLLASAIGSSSSRLVHSLLLQRFTTTSSANLQLLDEATEAIQYNRDVLQTAFDQLDHGITIFDSQYRLAFWNKQFRELLHLPSSFGRAGIPLSEIANGIVNIHRENDLDTNFDGLGERLLDDTKAWGLALTKFETILEIRTSQMPEGGIVIAWNNVTERMLVSEALHEANETLEKRVAERTSDLLSANQKLEKATASADLANESKTKFLAAAGHDLLQPLNAARLYTSTLKEKTQDLEHKRISQNIDRSLESVEEILGAVLAISRLDSTDPKMNIVNFPLQNIFEQIEIEFRPIADEKEIEFSILPTSAWIKSDPPYLRRLIQNLVSNAIKYTPNGRVLVGCKHEGDNVLIQILDTGIGIETSDQELVYSEFTRLDAGIQQAPGLGLGLSIVKRISDLLGHPVLLASTEGKGTRFRVKLPKVPAAQIMQAITSRKFNPTVNSLQGLRILCVDNDPSILDGMKSLLTQWGCDVVTAASSSKAIELLREKRFGPEISLIDYHLDNEDGFEAITKIRASGYAKLPAVLVTADRSPAVKKSADKKGISILNKPVKPAALRAILSQMKVHLDAAE